MAMKWLMGMLGVALLLLQYRLWLSDNGVSGVLQMKAATQAQQLQNQALSERNRQLAAEVRDLKQGYTALEERARNDLGMVGGNETFYQVVPVQSQPQGLSVAPTVVAPIRTAAR
jgi:cell division protein FtsB